jgi:hypothetical protein
LRSKEIPNFCAASLFHGQKMNDLHLCSEAKQKRDEIKLMNTGRKQSNEHHLAQRQRKEKQKMKTF